MLRAPGLFTRSSTGGKEMSTGRRGRQGGRLLTGVGEETRAGLVVYTGARSWFLEHVLMSDLDRFVG